MDWMKCCFLAVVAIVAIVYWHLKRVHSYWKKQNIPFVPGPIPIFGHMWPAISMKENIIEFVDRAYRNFNTSMVGFIFMQQPGVILRDPDLIKTVLQTNFTNFHGNLLELREKYDPLLGKNPFFTNEPNLWKVRRNEASANFTGKKLKYLSVIIQEVSEKMSAFINRKIQENNGFYECEFVTHFLKYTGEVVANAAFAIEGQSFEDNPNHLSFAKLVLSLSKPSFINGIKQALLFYVPSVANFFRLSYIDKRTESYMRANIKDSLQRRQQIDNPPNDFLQFCLEDNSDPEEILADVANFYLDAYETAGTVIANTFFCLSKNPEIQEKLRAHISSATKDNGNSASYESLKGMTYLDQVVQESLRHIPTLAVIMKYCTKAITLAGTDGLSCHLEPGNVVFIPVNSLHHDEKYWSDPEVFNPERFSAENQAKIKNYTLLSFGEGPRSCIGRRLGLLLVKHVVASLLLNYSVEPSSKTKVPLEIEPSVVFLSFKGGMWGKFKKLRYL